jgi:hypothetical protein
MNARKGGLILLGLLASLCLVSCGGGNSETASGGGIGGTGYVSSGTITAFGSIRVNGVEFDTGNALVSIAGRPAGRGNQAVRENLAVGQFVVVEGTVNQEGLSGNASRVSFTPHVKGPITELVVLDPLVIKIIVLGQTLIINEKTVLRDTTAGALAVNNFVEVSGLPDEGEVIRATFLRKRADTFAPSAEVEVKGMVQNLDFSGKTFRLGALWVDYSRAELFSQPDAGPMVGQWVRVKGRLGIGPRLEATEIGPADESIMFKADRLDVEGIVTEFVSGADFKVGSVKVQAQESTKFIGGRIEELAPGSRIRVRGRFLNGVLIAQQVFFHNPVQLESRISSKDSARRTLSLSGLEPITVTVTRLTKMAPGSREFEDLRAGDFIKIRGDVGTGSLVVAERMQVIPSPPLADSVVLQGPVEEIFRPNLVILGVTVDTSSIPGDHFEGFTGSDRPSEFFRNLQVGDPVKVRGKIAGTNQVLWEGISLEKGS